MRLLFCAAFFAPVLCFAQEQTSNLGPPIGAPAWAVDPEPFLFAQAKPPDPEVDPKAVNAAIDKGAQWLLGKFSQNRIPEPRDLELVLLTLIHAGVSPEHPLIRDNFQKMLDHQLSDTYTGGLPALGLGDR